MFFPDEHAALREMRRVLRPDGRLALSVWGAASEVPLVEAALACMRRLLPPPKVARPSIFRFGDPASWIAVSPAPTFATATSGPVASLSNSPMPPPTGRASSTSPAARRKACPGCLRKSSASLPSRSPMSLRRMPWRAVSG
jgi:SAM-dependent methyltransferase